MVTTADKRAWLADHGYAHLKGGRGVLSAEQEAAYADAHPADDYEPGADPADFAEPDEPGPPPPPAAPPPPAGEFPAEEQPARPGRPRGSWRRGRTRKAREQRAPRERQPKPPRPARARMSVAPLIEDLYSDLAWASGGMGLAPLQRCFYAQAPIAGVILDPVVKGTFMDRLALQPMVRNYQKGQVLAALVGVPASLMTVLATAPAQVVEDGQVVYQEVIGPDGKPVLVDGQPLLQPRMQPVTPRHMLAMLNLRYCVRAMATLSGDAMKRVQERAEENEERDAQVNEFIAFLVDGQVPQDQEQTDRQEGQAAGLRLAGVG